MSNINYITSIVKVLETPNKILFNNTIPVTRFRVQLPQNRNTQIVNLIFWGNLAESTFNYYNINDYIIIEGYLSSKNILTSARKNLKKIEITVFKIYPFLLDSNRNISSK